jgi:bis(5'-nucleosidyl)-tetraphosphatase
MSSTLEQVYGIIPLRQNQGQWQVLLVLHSKGNFWGFPKGHSEPGETPQETASRELQEETGLRVKNYFPKPSLQEEYDFLRDGKPIHKKAAYFLAEVEGAISLQSSETLGCQWANLQEAENLITFSQSKALLPQILEWLL